MERGGGEEGGERKESHVVLRSGEKIKWNYSGNGVCRVALGFFVTRRQRPADRGEDGHACLERKEGGIHQEFGLGETIAQVFRNKIVPTIYFPNILLKSPFLKNKIFESCSER